MIDQETRQESRSGDHRPACIDYAAQERRQAVEVRQYQHITKAVQAAARTYAKRTGSRINQTDTTTADLAADAYIISQETPQRPKESPADHIRRAAYEAVRRASRAQQRHAHAETPDDQGTATQAPGDLLEAIAIRQAIQQAGRIADLLVQGYTPADISRRLRVSPSTAWRLADKAREAVRTALYL